MKNSILTMAVLMGNFFYMRYTSDTWNYLFINFSILVHRLQVVFLSR